MAIEPIWRAAFSHCDQTNSGITVLVTKLSFHAHIRMHYSHNSRVIWTNVVNSFWYVFRENFDQILSQNRTAVNHSRELSLVLSYCLVKYFHFWLQSCKCLILCKNFLDWSIAVETIIKSAARFNRALISHKSCIYNVIPVTRILI